MGRAHRLTPGARLVLGAIAGCLTLVACSATTNGQGSAARDSAHDLPSGNGAAVTQAPVPSSAPGSGGASAGCPTTYAQPDRHRPRVRLRFTFAAGLGTVAGAETIAFTPDKTITELVFRLTANTVPTVAQGNHIVVSAASADHGGGKYTFSRANAALSTQGGLLRIPFARPVPAGTTVTAQLAFTVTLGADSFDRFGRAGQFAYIGSAHPLLAWERGYGWHTENLIDFAAESATSEAMDTDLTVTAPAADTVITSGDPADPPRGGATRTWHSRIAAARDVSVAVGPFAVADTMVGSVKLRVGAPDAGLRDALVPEFRRAITELAKRFGPFPFPSLSVARVPAQGGGIEYPSSILMLDGSRLVAVHETAHQWFYAMLGDSQALHPWLDEAFASYAEQLVNQDPEDPAALTAPGKVDSSTESYGANMQGYYFTTYDKGAAALEAARAAAGAAKWDATIRCYVAANAWRIVDPPDLAKALAKLPAGVAVLRRAGALP
jgi:hypothetical protein